MNLELFKLAIIHSSVAKEINDQGFKESNERLEYLGDAILGAVVAEYLFQCFPFKDEGFLTEIRSRIVSRESLNKLARKIGLDQLMIYDLNRKGALSFKFIFGDAMEAFVGAVYLDRGFEFCQNFIIKKLVQNHFDLNEIVANNPNYKSKIIEWSQRNNKTVRFVTLEEEGYGQHRQFTVNIVIGEEVISKGNGYSKKKAEQDAARRACEQKGIE